MQGAEEHMSLARCRGFQRPGDLRSLPGSTTQLPRDLGQVTQPLWASVSALADGNTNSLAPRDLWRMKVNNEMSLAQCLALGRALVSGGGSCNYPKMEQAGSAGEGQRESGQLSFLVEDCRGLFCTDLRISFSSCNCSCSDNIFSLQNLVRQAGITVLTLKKRKLRLRVGQILLKFMWRLSGRAETKV